MSHDYLCLDKTLQFYLKKYFFLKKNLSSLTSSVALKLVRCHTWSRYSLNRDEITVAIL